MVVVFVGEERHEVRGRVADMICWLLRAAERINAGSVTVRFACRGPRLKASIEHEETIA